MNEEITVTDAETDAEYQSMLTTGEARGGGMNAARGRFAAQERVRARKEAAAKAAVPTDAPAAPVSAQAGAVQ